MFFSENTNAAAFKTNISHAFFLENQSVIAVNTFYRIIVISTNKSTLYFSQT